MSARIHKTLNILMAWLSTHGLNCDSFDRVKLLRLKYLRLQTNKYLSEFLKWLVSMFTVMDSLIFEYAGSMNIVCEYRVNIVWISYEYRESMCCLFRLRIRRIGQMNTQVRLLNLLFRFTGRVNSELVGSMHNTERMIRKLFAIFTVQFNTQSRNTF